MVLKVMEEEWDYLVVLDGCRYDYFKRLNPFEGNLERRKSLGSNTYEWFKENFTGVYPDTIYVSANPWISKMWLSENLGYDPIPFPVIDEVFRYAWSEKHNTVPPSAVTEAALKNIGRFPGCRVIIHYLQPHAPFINLWDGAKEVIKKLRGGSGGIMEAAREGKIGRGEIRLAYAKNLQYVLGEVAGLLENVDGRIVLTSDHGDLLGEGGMYGHLREYGHPILRDVQWFEID